MLVAALGVEHFFAVASAVLQLDLQSDSMTPFIAERFELRVLEDFDFFCRFHDRFAVNRLLGNLIDEKIAVVQQHGDAERQIHLRRGHALRLVGPADVELGGAGGANADLVDVLGANLRVLAENFFQRIDGRVIAAAARIRFAADVESLEALAQILSQVRQIRIVAEGRAEAAVGRFENILDAGKSFGREQRAIDARLSGAAGVHPLHHRSVLSSHESRGLSAGDAQRMESLERI